MWVARNLSGAAGPSETDVTEFQSWLLCFVQSSAIIKEEMAAWTDWLSNKSTPWEAYRANMAARLVALEKSLGLKTVVIREVFRRLLAKLVFQVGGAQSKEAYGGVNLCAGLEGSIEGAMHAVREREEIGRGEAGTEQRERLELADETRIREDLGRKRGRRRQGRALATIPEEMEGGEESKVSVMEELEDLQTYLSGGAEEIMAQETIW